MSNLEILQRYALAIEHPEDVVIRLYKELRGAREGLVRREPRRLRMSVKADDREAAYFAV